MGHFDEIKSQAKDLEKEIESKLEDLSRLNFQIYPDALEVSFEKSQESILISRIQFLLDQLKETIPVLQKSSSTQYEKSLTTGFIHTHKTAQKTLNDLKTSISDKRWQQQLYGNQVNNVDFTKAEMLMREERMLDESLEVGKNIMAAAREVKISMAYQDNKLGGVSQKVKKFAGMIPGINFIMKRISARHKVNAVVMGISISICLCIIVYRVL